MRRQQSRGSWARRSNEECRLAREGARQQHRCTAHAATTAQPGTPVAATTLRERATPGGPAGAVTASSGICRGRAC
eukprot:4160024-Prymnesium_polylepis.1